MKTFKLDLWVDVDAEDRAEAIQLGNKLTQELVYKQQRVRDANVHNVEETEE